MVKKDSSKSDYTTMQGYTIGEDCIHVALMQIYKQENKLVFVKGEGYSKVTEASLVSDNKLLGHGNDCAYYDGGYFVVQGGGESKETTEQDLQIKRFGAKLESPQTFTYTPMPVDERDANYVELEKLSCIAYIKWNYFIVGSGKDYSVCQMDTSTDTKRFVEKSQFHLQIEDGDLVRTTNSDDNKYTRHGQGIYCINNKLYKGYSYKLGTSPITENDIAEFELLGGSPSFSGKAKLKTVYNCDKTGKKLFELESISSPVAGGDLHISANVTETGADKQSDAIYKIELKKRLNNTY